LKIYGAKINDSGVPPTHIMQISGHKNIQSITNYRKINETQHRNIGFMFTRANGLSNQSSTPATKNITTHSTHPPVQELPDEVTEPPARAITAHVTLPLAQQIPEVTAPSVKAITAQLTLPPLPELPDEMTAPPAKEYRQQPVIAAPQTSQCVASSATINMADAGNGAAQAPSLLADMIGGSLGVFKNCSVTIGKLNITLQQPKASPPPPKKCKSSSSNSSQD
jgi:hypothetical protein